MVYTRQGDEGKTSLISGERVYKDDIEVEVYGNIDELLSFLGLSYSIIENERVKRDLKVVINDLHNLIIDISDRKGRINSNNVRWLEMKIDEYSKILKPLNTFILEISSEKAAFLNVSRAICRRVERRLFTLSKAKEVPKDILAYINRLSDFLFTLYRYINAVEDINEEKYVNYDTSEKE